MQQDVHCTWSKLRWMRRSRVQRWQGWIFICIISASASASHWLLCISSPCILLGKTCTPAYSCSYPNRQSLGKQHNAYNHIASVNVHIKHQYWGNCYLCKQHVVVSGGRRRFSVTVDLLGFTHNTCRSSPLLTSDLALHFICAKILATLHWEMSASWQVDTLLKFETTY